LALQAPTLEQMRIGTTIIVVGVALTILGALVRFFPGAFSWFGNLPGDIRIEGENSRVFVPLTSMILVSVVGTVILNLALRLFRGN
jgi:hypothetical protein